MFNFEKLSNHMLHYAKNISTIKTDQVIWGYLACSADSYNGGREKIIRFANGHHVNFIIDDLFDDERKNLHKLIEVAKVNDSLIVTDFAQLGSNLEQLVKILRRILNKEICVYVIGYGKIKNDEKGTFLLDAISLVNSIEVEMRSSAVKKGKQKAKFNSKSYREGRPRRTISDRYLTIYKAVTIKGMSYQEAADMFNVSKSTVYRIKKQIDKLK
ncbi:recombinase family protein [Lactobacillus sp. ESL0785]|uniref:recombinase family protein n=1 Tax=Lactobacillus sp. ESL0785 TaxID=2983232 RepID=UPI0023F61A43|nr:recombinase family protein [Lactobacillus sp. ESL0785]WEV70915.1 recombinase family protein [Lactobacillus sp. ESL0785]